MKEIGGYFEVEYSNIELGIHSNAIKLITGRQCLEYILLSKKYTRVYLPYYLCDVVLAQLTVNNIAYAFYNINDKLEIKAIPQLQNNEALLYINYFGIKNDYALQLAGKVSNLIIDNSQALFAPPVQGIDTFYSLRKFAGTADGGFLYCEEDPSIVLTESDSSDRVTHLFKRKNKSAAEGYKDFQESETKLIGMPLGKMSKSTEAFVKTYDFSKNKIARERNFLFLHHHLQSINRLKIDTTGICGPLCYPLLCENAATLKQKLIANKVFVATYWPNIIDSPASAYEYSLSESILALPIDHRYEPKVLQVIIDLIKA